MAKTSGKQASAVESAPESESPAPAEKTESTAAYWKRILLERPRLITSKGANETLRDIWLKDHPGQTEVPANIVANLANVKSQLRSKRGKTKRTATAAETAVPAAAVPTNTPARQRALQALEDRIDDCLMLARDLNQPDLANVIDRLRKARNEVVVQIGQ